MQTLLPVPGWKGKFLLGPRHSYWWKETPENEPRPLSGVTSVLNVIAKPALIQWAANCSIEQVKEHVSLLSPLVPLGDIDFSSILESARTAHTRKKDTAAGLGKDAHALVEDYIKDCIAQNKGLPYEANSTESRVNEFAQVAIRERWTFVASETPLADPKLALAGTPDFIAKMDDKVLIGDLKTGSGIYDRTYFAQMAAYGFMWAKRVKGKGTLKLVIVHAPSQKPEQPIALYWSEDWRGDWEAFKAALYLHRWKDNFARP